MMMMLMMMMMWLMMGEGKEGKQRKRREKEGDQENTKQLHTQPKPISTPAQLPLLLYLLYLLNPPRPPLEPPHPRPLLQQPQPLLCTIAPSALALSAVDHRLQQQGEAESTNILSADPVEIIRAQIEGQGREGDKAAYSSVGLDGDEILRVSSVGDQF
jgi:hypothetical protein